MTIQEVIKKIDRYLKKDNVEPLIVDVQNKADLEAIMLHYQLPQNVFLCASDAAFCKPDESPTFLNALLMRIPTFLSVRSRASSS